MQVKSVRELQTIIFRGIFTLITGPGKRCFFHEVKTDDARYGVLWVYYVGIRGGYMIPHEPPEAEILHIIDLDTCLSMPEEVYDNDPDRIEAIEDSLIRYAEDQTTEEEREYTRQLEKIYEKEGMTL